MRPGNDDAYGAGRDDHARARRIGPATFWRWLGEGERFLWLLAGLAVAWRLWWLWRFWRRHPAAPEDFEEGDIARNILSGRGYSAGPDWLTPFGQPTAHKPPLFTWILVACYWLFDESRVPVTVLNSALLVLANVLLYLLARKLVDERVAKVAALAFLASPVTAHTGLSVTNTALAITVVLWALNEFACFLETRGKRRAARSGLALGILALAIPAALALAIPTLWYAWRGRSGGHRMEVRCRPEVTRDAQPAGPARPQAVSEAGSSRPNATVELALLLAVAFAIVLPWTVRNWLTFRAFVPVGSSLPLEFAIGNGPNANGGLVTADGQPVAQPPPEQVEEARAAGLDEVRAYQSYGAKALAWSVENPRRFLVLRLRSLGFFLVPQNFFYYPLDRLAVAKLTFTLLFLPLAAVGAVTAWKTLPRSRFLVVGVIVFTALYAMTHANVNSRYREPIDPLLVLLASVAVVRLGDLVASRSRPSPSNGRKARSPKSARHLGGVEEDGAGH